MIENVKILKNDEIIFSFKNKIESEEIFSKLLELEIASEYVVELHYTKFDSDFINSFLEKFSIFDFLRIIGINSSDGIVSIKFLFEDRKFYNEEWDSLEYKKVLLKKNIENFNFKIDGPNEFVKYFNIIFNSFSEKYDYLITKNIFIIFSLLSKLLSDNDNIKMSIGDFEIEDITEEEDDSAKFGVNKKVKSQFEFFINSTELFDLNKSKIEYINKKINLDLVISKSIGTKNEIQEN